MSLHLSTGIVIILVLAGRLCAAGEPQPFGKTADGTAVESFMLKNKNGMTVKLMSLGATITEINVPDKQGKFSNVVLGFDDVAGYQSDRNQYFGCTTGRVCNRIAKGMFTLDGTTYKLAVNNGVNHLHGGAKRSLDKVVWEGIDTTGAAKNEIILPSGVNFVYSSPDGEEGYPGKLGLIVAYSLNEQNELRISYEAKTDKPTPVNLTNHSYFNLAGAGADTVLDHELMLAADEYLPTDDTQIPTGKLQPVKGSIFDFSKPTRLGARIEKLYDSSALGYDHCYVLTKREKTPTLAGKLRDPSSGRVMTILTTQPGIQLYTGNHLSGKKGKDGKEFKKRSAVCLETAHFPDAVNQPAFPSIILRPGETYRHTCIYAFSVE